jgi:hypothetical protein
LKLAICLFALGVSLAAGAALAAGGPGTTAVISPALDTLPKTSSDCTPVSPCAALTPELETTSDAPATTAKAQRSSATPGAKASAAADTQTMPCLPAGLANGRRGRGGFGGGTGFAGRRSGQGDGQRAGGFAGRGRGGAGFAGRGRNGTAAQGGNRPCAPTGQQSDTTPSAR